MTAPTTTTTPTTEDITMSTTNTPTNTLPTMSSVTLAELTDKRHDNIMVDITKLLNELGILTPELSSVRIVRGKEYPIFNLPKRECDLLIMGYSIPLQIAVLPLIEQHFKDSKVVTNPSGLTMSSVELSELLDIKHSRVMCEVTEQCQELSILTEQFCSVRLVRGKEYPTMNLPKDVCDIYVMGKSTTLRAKVYYRWVELEAGEAKPTLQKEVPIQAIPVSLGVQAVLDKIEVQKLEDKLQKLRNAGIDDRQAEEDAKVELLKSTRAVAAEQKQIEHIRTSYARSASQLLIEYGDVCSIHTFNKAAIKAKVLTRKRPYQVTMVGKQWGTNVLSGRLKLPQPRFYGHCFEELLIHLDLIG